MTMVRRVIFLMTTLLKISTIITVKVMKMMMQMLR